jgi:hypothetical protein
MADVSILPSNKPEDIQVHMNEFEEWFVATQKDHDMEGAQLMSFERAIVLAHLAFLRIKEKSLKEKRTHVQAQ